jgi:hypothetical protein
MRDTFLDKGKNKVDDIGRTEHAVTHQKPLDVVRLSSESTRENPRLLAVTKEAAQARDGYSKGSLYEQQREKQQRELRQKATGGWHPQDLSHPIPEQRLLGGVLTDSNEITKDFLTAAEWKARNEYNTGSRTKKAKIAASLYRKASHRISCKALYNKQDVLDELNDIRQSREYIDAFAEAPQHASETDADR